LGVSGVEQGAAAIEELYKRQLQGVSDLKEAEGELLRAAAAQKNALVAYTPEAREEGFRELARAEGSFEELAGKVKALARDGEEQALHAAIAAGWKDFRGVSAEIAARLKADQADQAFQLANGRGAETFRGTMDAIGKFVAHRKQAAAAEYQASLDRVGRSRLLLLGLALLGAAAGLAAGYAVARAVTHPLGRIVTGLRKLEEGDLTYTLDIRSGDEVGTVAQAYDRFTARLRDIVRDVQSAALRVSDAVALVSAGAGGRGRSAAGAATIEETSSAMQQIAAAAEQNADLAGDAARRFDAANQSAAGGRQAVDELVAAVNQIDESGRKISKIIHVMDEIALQTNLLALNAAVEAAHAGEEGKGFAVVATEVRNLAQRSAEAAKDITALIADSSQKSAAGRELAARAGRALEDMQRHGEEVDAMIKSIASGSREQRESMEGATRSITAIDRTMRQNVEEVTRLRELVSFFRTGA